MQCYLLGVCSAVCNVMLPILWVWSQVQCYLLGVCSAVCNAAYIVGVEPSAVLPTWCVFSCM